MGKQNLIVFLRSVKFTIMRCSKCLLLLTFVYTFISKKHNNISHSTNQKSRRLSYILVTTRTWNQKQSVGEPLVRILNLKCTFENWMLSSGAVGTVYDNCSFIIVILVGYCWSWGPSPGIGLVGGRKFIYLMNVIWNSKYK